MMKSVLLVVLTISVINASVDGFPRGIDAKEILNRFPGLAEHLESYELSTDFGQLEVIFY